MTAEPARRRGTIGAVLLWAAALSGAGPALAPAPAAAQGDGGISVGEYHRVFPPAPVGVRAVREGAAVVVSWSPPPKVATDGRPAYDPEVASYRVYRVDGAGGRMLAGEVDAAATRFRDDRPGAADSAYAVTAVQRSGQESGLSGAAEAPPP